MSDMSEDSASKNFRVRIRTNMKPGDTGMIVYLHGTLYAEEYGFDHTFEPYVAEPLSRFVLESSDDERIWIAERGERMVGSVAIVKFSRDVAQLRWLLVHPSERGGGLGKTLVKNAVEFSVKRGYASVFLWTLNILPAATHIYESFGFKKVERKPGRVWGVDLVEEKYVLETSARP